MTQGRHTSDGAGRESAGRRVRGGPTLRRTRALRSAYLVRNSLSSLGHIGRAHGPSMRGGSVPKMEGGLSDIKGSTTWKGRSYRERAAMWGVKRGVTLRDGVSTRRDGKVTESMMEAGGAHGRVRD